LFIATNATELNSTQLVRQYSTSSEHFSLRVRKICRCVQRTD